MSNQKYRKGKFAKKKPQHKAMGLPVLILVDVLLVGIILLTFAFFHHVLPAMINEFERQQELMNVTDPVETGFSETLPSDAPIPPESEETGASETVPPATEETIPETEPDNRWMC